MPALSRLLGDSALERSADTVRNENMTYRNNKCATHRDGVLALARAIYATAFLCVASFGAAAAPPPFQRFNDSLKAFTRGAADNFETYMALRHLYAEIDPPHRNYAAQMLSMYDAMNGRYEDADIHFRESFPGATKPRSCPIDGYRSVPLKEAITSVALDSRVLMINESHSEIGTRALILRMLPILRKAGFRNVAFEALAGPKDMPGWVAGASVLPLDDRDLVTRGYPLDSNQAGFYLREPVFGELIRHSIQLGFNLVAYDPRNFSSRDDREEKEARNLKAFLDEHPHERLLVIAGYSHIWKTGGWMADRLRTMGDYKITSVDQIDGWGGCEGTTWSKSYPFVFMSRSSNSEYWAYKKGTDVTVLNLMNNQRGARTSWLSLNGFRRKVTLPGSVCNGLAPCLVSATYILESADAVPADRLFVLEGEKPILYLRPNTYRLTAQTGTGKLVWRLQVDQEGETLEPVETQARSHRNPLKNSR